MIADEITKVSYLGDGTTTSFPFSFAYDAVTDIKAVIHNTETDTETSITSDYYIDTTAKTYNYPGYAPGQEKAETEQPPVLTSKEKLVIYRSTPETQLIDMGEKYPLPTIESTVDKLTMIAQEHAELISRSIKTTIGSTTSPDELMEELNKAVINAVAASETATTKAEAAGTSATEAATSATTAINEAEAAGTSATAAAGSATEAAGKVTACQAVVDGAIEDIKKVARAVGLPIGTIIPYSSNGDYPNGFLLCDGASVSRAMYPDLFTVIGTTYGAVDDEHFSLPNLTDKFIEGSSTAGTEIDAAASGTDISAITMRYIVKAFDGQTAESALIDVTQYANELANHATQIAGKVSKSEADYVVDSGTSTDGTMWYRRYKSGWLEQGGTGTTPSAGYMTITFLADYDDNKLGLVAVAGSASRYINLRTVLFSNLKASSVTVGTLSSSGSYSALSFSWYACGQGADE